MQAQRLGIISALRRCGARAGFQEIATPALEYTEVLLGQGSEETDKQVYRFEDHGGRDVAMRFDLTVPFARYVGENQGEMTFPFKRLQVGPVWRGENTQKGRYREFYQADVDIIGVDSWLADFEVISVLSQTLDEIGFGSFTVSLGHRALLSGLIKKFLPHIASEDQVLIAIDKWDKIGQEKVGKLISEIDGADPSSTAGLVAALASDTGIDHLEELLGDSLKPEFVRLQQMLEALHALSLGHANFQVDLKIARGLGYYTGVVFETTLDELPGFGSVCSGGRYDTLASRFTSRELAGVGGSIGVDRLIAGLVELSRVTSHHAADVLVAIACEQAQAYGLRVAAAVRKLGVSCDIGLQRKLQQQFRHADRLGCLAVIIVGDEEMVAEEFTFKNLSTGDQTKNIPLGQLANQLHTLGTKP